MKKYFLLFLILFSSGNTINAQNCTWKWQNPLPQGNTLNSIRFINNNTGWAVGNTGTILKTTDAGTSWLRISSGTFNNLQSVFFVDSISGWVAGDNGTILRTTDGGLNWNTLSKIGRAHV